jgi:hypothetical protein
MNIEIIGKYYLLSCIIYTFFVVFSSLKNKKKLEIADLIYFFYWPLTSSFNTYHKVDKYLRKKYTPKEEKKPKKMGFDVSSSTEDSNSK